MSAPRCARAGCENVVVRQPGRPGRPPIYCSPGCRPSGTGASKITVELVRTEYDDDVSPARLAWNVQLRKGRRWVIVATAMGQFGAMAFADELRGLFEPRRQKGGTTE
jgi:hypothetical protein